MFYRLFNYLWPVLLLTGCNGDVFIDDFLPEPKPIVLSDAEGNVSVRFNAENWDILYIESIRSDMFADARDTSGNRIGFPIENEENAVIQYGNEYLDLRIEKNSRSELNFILSENLYDEPVELGIKVGNQYTSKTLEVSLSPTQKYQIDSIVYQWDKFKLYTNTLEEMDAFTVDNTQSSTPVRWTVFPYRYSSRKIEFYCPNASWNGYDYTRYLGEPLPQIDIPDVTDGKPALQGTKARLGMEYQNLETGLDKNLEVEATVEAGDRRKIIVYNQMEIYDIPYKAYTSNPKNGKRHMFSGTLSSSRPYDYFIFKQQLTDEEQ